jgi:hypothetical protein
MSAQATGSPLEVAQSAPQASGSSPVVLMDEPKASGSPLEVRR